MDSLKQIGLLPTFQVLEGNIPTLEEARRKEMQWIQRLQAAGAQLINLVHVREHQLGIAKLRLSLGISQKEVAHRTRSVSIGTIKRAEKGERVTYDTATQILEALNNLLEERNRTVATLEDLELNLYEQPSSSTARSLRTKDKPVPVMADTPLKRIRLELGVSQEGVARRTRSVSTGTVKNAENGRRVAYSNAIQILEAINGLLVEAGRSPMTLEDLGLNLY